MWVWTFVWCVCACVCVRACVCVLLHDIREARDTGDHARSKCLHTELEQLGKELSIPIHTAGNIVVPNLTPVQKNCRFQGCEKNRQIHKHKGLVDESDQGGTVQPT